MPKKTKWVLVADGERAKFLVQQDSTLVPLYPTHHAEADVPTHKDKSAAKPGQVFNSSVKSLETLPSHTDWHRFQKDLFSVEVAKMLNKEADQFDAVVIIAPPLTLGDLRKSLSPQVQQKVVHEVNKDLTKVPLNELMEYVTPPYK